MADEPKNENEDAQEPQATKSKKPLFLGGGAVLLLGLAYLAATLAVPGQREIRRFKGPFVIQLFANKIHINLNVDGKKRFLQMNFNAVYTAYEESYVAARVADPLYLPYIDHAVRAVSMQKTIDDVMGGQTRTQLYLQEIREVVGPILFPVHVGPTEKPTDRDEASGLAPGLSIGEATFRVPFDQGRLFVDGPARTVRLGEGEPVEFDGSEDDLRVADEQGRVVYLDVTALEATFQGELPIGIKGSVREVLLKDLLVQ